MASLHERLESRIARTLHGRFLNACAGHAEPTSVPAPNCNQVLASSPIVETKDLAFDVQLGLRGDGARMPRQATADRTAQIAPIAKFARNKLVAEWEAKANAKRLASNCQQLGRALVDAKLAREVWAEAKKAAAQAFASKQQALQESRVAKATLAQVQAAFAEAIHHAKSSTVVTMTEKQAEGLEDHGVQSFIRLKTVSVKLGHVLAEKGRLRNERDFARKQLDDGVIGKIL